MINKEIHPVEWAGLMYELDDAREHLSSLIVDMMGNSEFDEIDFKIQLEHVYSHLNRAWNRRNLNRNFSETEWIEASRFPSDLEPI